MRPNVTKGGYGELKRLNMKSEAKTLTSKINVTNTLSDQI